MPITKWDEIYNDDDKVKIQEEERKNKTPDNGTINSQYKNVGCKCNTEDKVKWSEVK